jgi:branched-chain amino acid transport system permease protein
MEQFFEGVQALVDGAMFGSIYALIGIGFTLVFGITRRLNLGYAAASLAAAYLGIGLGQYLSESSIVMVAISIAAGAVLGALIYYTCFHVTMTGHRMGPLVSTFGLLLFASAATGYATNWEPLLYPDLADLGLLDIGKMSVRADLIVVLAICGACTLLLYVVLFRSRLGLAIRALAQQPLVAQLCGISVIRLSLATFALTGAVGGLAAGMTGVAVGVLSPLLVMPLTIKGLTVAVIGGLGNVRGAIVAGLLVGAVENMSLFVRGVFERDLYVMVLLFGFLMFRPQGLFGKTPAEGAGTLSRGVL